MNQICLTGRLSKEIELRNTNNGKFVANGTIAVKRDFKNQNGEYETDFINFVALGKTGELMANYVKKGDSFGLTGRLQIRKYEKDGKTQYFTEVIVNGFDFPSKPRNGQSEGNYSRNQNKGSEGDPFANGGAIDIEEDLPF